MLQQFRALPTAHQLESGAIIPSDKDHCENWTKLCDQDSILILGFDYYKIRPDATAEDTYHAVNEWLQDNVNSDLKSVAWRYSKRCSGIHVLAFTEQRWTAAQNVQGWIDVITTGSSRGARPDYPQSFDVSFLDRNSFPREVKAYEWVQDGTLYIEDHMHKLSRPRVSVEHVSEWTPETTLTDELRREYMRLAEEQEVPTTKGGRQHAIYVGARRIGEAMVRHGEEIARQAMKDFVESHIVRIREPWAASWDAFLRSNKGLLKELTGHVPKPIPKDKISYFDIDYELFTSPGDTIWTPVGIVCLSNYEVFAARSGQGKTTAAFYQASQWMKGLAIIGTETGRGLAMAYMRKYDVDCPVVCFDPHILTEQLKTADPRIHLDYISTTFEHFTEPSAEPFIVVEDQYAWTNAHMSAVGGDYYTKENEQDAIWTSVDEHVRITKHPVSVHSKLASNDLSAVKGNRKVWEVARVRREISRDGEFGKMKVTGSAIGSDWEVELKVGYFNDGPVRRAYYEGYEPVMRYTPVEWLQSLQGRTFKQRELYMTYMQYVEPNKVPKQATSTIHDNINKIKALASSNNFSITETVGRYNEKSYTIGEKV